jgi:hypothetical protein
VRTKEEIIYVIENNAQAIVDNILKESIDVYSFLKTEFENSNVTENYLFQFVYRSFYRLDNAGLTDQFKKDYFNILQSYRQLDNFDFSTILTRLYNIQNHQGQNTFQFSFVTKMQNTIYNDRPIYDSEVARVFSFRQPKQGIKFDDKLTFYLNQLEIIRNTYASLIANKNIQNVINSFDTKFYGNNLGEIKKLDFIFWAAGKVIRKLDLQSTLSTVLYRKLNA